MDLDKRIKNNHRPLCVIDIKWAMGFIGKNGFFADAINHFENLSSCPSGKLSNVEDKKIFLFECDDKRKYSFFIPEEWVEPKEEKKYRPYTLAEWVDQHEIGEVIHYRDKDYKQQFHVMYSGYIIDEGEDIQDVRTIGRIVFMFTAYFLEELFKDYEICINGEWRPFGIKEK